MKHKSWFSILFDLALILIVAWATLHYSHQLRHAKEEIEVLRNGFFSVLCMIALAGTVIISRLQDLVDKD